MRRLILIFAILSLLFMSSIVWAAGTVTQTYTRPTKDITLLTYSWIADAALATVPATTSVEPIDGYVFLVTTNPDGTTAPDDNYGITLTDSDGVDIMGGELLARDTANSEQAVPKIDSIYGPRFVSGVLILTITSNTVVSAAGTVNVYYYR